MFFICIVHSAYFYLCRSDPNSLCLEANDNFNVTVFESNSRKTHWINISHLFA